MKKVLYFVSFIFLILFSIKNVNASIYGPINSYYNRNDVLYSFPSCSNEFVFFNNKIANGKFYNSVVYGASNYEPVSFTYSFCSTDANISVSLSAPDIGLSSKILKQDFSVSQSQDCTFDNGQTGYTVTINGLYVSQLNTVGTYVPQIDFSISGTNPLSLCSLGGNYSEYDPSSQEVVDGIEDLNDSITSDSKDTTSGSCGIICKLKGIFTGIIELPVKVANLIIDGIKSLFIPSDMDFINNFVDSIENKLGLIAEVPASIIEFILSLASASWEDYTSLTFPSITVFGVSFWNEVTVDLTPAIEIFEPYKYITDVICVTLVCWTLLRWWENFTGGGKS